MILSNGLPEPEVRLAGRVIRRGAPPLIIAEAGVNHDGSVRKARELIDAAADAGADAVKFQVFRARDLTTAAAPTAEYQRSSGGDSQQRMLERLELPEDDWIELCAYARQKKIAFLATPFALDDLARLAALGVPAIKIASTDIDNDPLLDAARELGVPLIVSTGAALPEEIDRTVARIRLRGAAGRLILLHCVSRYPTPVADANLHSIAALRARHGVPVGFSDHTESTNIGGWAVAAGAVVLEKHLTLDRTATGPDHAMSLDPAEFATYVGVVREMQRTLGEFRYGMSPAEAEVRRVARKSVVTRRLVRAGEALTTEMLTLKRPGTGIAPPDLPRIVGRRVTADIPADTVVQWAMVES